MFFYTLRYYIYGRSGWKPCIRAHLTAHSTLSVSWARSIWLQGSCSWSVLISYFASSWIRFFKDILRVMSSYWTRVLIWKVGNIRLQLVNIEPIVSLLPDKSKTLNFKMQTFLSMLTTSSSSFIVFFFAKCTPLPSLTFLWFACAPVLIAENRIIQNKGSTCLWQVISARCLK